MTSLNFQFIPALALLLLIALFSPAFTQIAVEPFGLALGLPDEQNRETSFTILNDGQEDFAFSDDFGVSEFLPLEGEERQVGPRRDRPGEIIREMRVNYFNTVGMAWDPGHGWLWAKAWSARRIYAVDPENGQMPVDLAINGSYLGMFYREANNSLYLGGYSAAPNAIIRYNTQGQLVENLRIERNMSLTTIGGDERYVYTLAYPSGGGHGDVHVYDLDNGMREVATIDCNEWIGDEGWGIEIIHAHRRNWLWLFNRTHAFQFSVDEDWNPQLVRTFETVNTGHTGLAHDGENLWRGTYDGQTAIWYEIDDGVPERLNLVVDPPSGVVPAGDWEMVSISVDPEGADAGVYYGYITLNLAPVDEDEDPETTIVEMALVVSIAAPTAGIAGVITDARDDSPLFDARVSLNGWQYYRLTDGEGEYAMTDLPRGVYEVTVSAPDFLPHTEEIDLSEVEVAEFNWALQHAAFAPNPREIVAQVAPDDHLETNLRVTNDGNGPLTYSVDRRLIGDANADPWTLRASHQVAAPLEDNYLQGVAFAEDHFYVAGQHGRAPVIYVLDRDGNLEGSFRQPGPDDRGFNDLAWDGELLWGISGAVVIGFTLEGEERIRFNAPFNLCKNIAWDAVNECLWISATTSNIARVSRDGQTLASLRAMFTGEQLRMYGLDCYPQDAAQHGIYIYAKERDTNRTTVLRMNVEGDIQFITYLDHEDGGDPMGICVTNQYDIYSWVLIAVANNAPDLGGDRVDVWQIEARKDWMQIDPTEGVIPSGETQVFTITLDAAGLPPAVFRGELVFTHDGVGGESIIPITLSVVEGPVESERTLNLLRGWNMVSVNLQPEPADDVRALTRPLVEDQNLLLMKDGAGNFYNPEFDFNNIPGWNVAEGYLIKTDHDAELTLRGITVMADDPIPLIDGWQMVAYYPRLAVDATVALAGIVDQLQLAKDGEGCFYNPEWGFSNMGNMEEGQGYQLKLDGDAELVYRLQAERIGNYELRITNYESRLPQHVNTGANMSLLALAEGWDGQEVGVYAGEELVGSGVVVDGRCGIAVWGDDATTPEVDGAAAGQELRVEFNRMDRIDRIVMLKGSLNYSTDAFAVVRVATALPTEFSISGVYPNPFNSTLTINYAVPSEGLVSLKIIDLNGREITTLVNSRQDVGNYRVNWQAESMPSGVYFCRMEAACFSQTAKLTLMR